MWPLELLRLGVSLCFILSFHEVGSFTASPPCDSPDGNCNKVNVAQGKAASMSTPYEEPGYRSGPASLAVDGNTSTYYTSCVHTMGDQDSEPDWWQVDLGHNYTVTNITIYHRGGGPDRNPFSQRIAGVWIYVDDTLCYKFPHSFLISNEQKEKDDITCYQPIRGQIVKFTKEGFVHDRHHSYINFCEVQIWVCRPGLYGKQCDKRCDSHCPQGLCDNYDGLCGIEVQDSPVSLPPPPPSPQSSASPACDSPDGNCNRVNVAQGKAASMSAPYEQPGYRSGPASLAVDGNTSLYYTSCVHTLGDQDSEPDWWQVDLGHNYTITNITIYHREGGPDHNPFTQRIAGVWIYVDDTLCYKFPDSHDIGNERKEKDDVTCQQPIRGQTVKFVKEGFIHDRHHSNINFCEVQIWACRSGLYGAQCDKKCNSHCRQGLCDNYDGTCQVGCSEGYYGADCSEQCGQCQGQETCDRHTGQCLLPGVESTTESPAQDTPEGNIVDVAIGKAANMSAPYDRFGSSPQPPSLAVDGNTSSCVHTLGDLDNDPDWWQVDLGRSYTITNITIYHRDSVYLHNQRIAGVWIYVDDTLCYKFPDSFDIGHERKLKDDITCNRPIRGQIVRFSKEGYIHAGHYSFINFCEIQIWVCRPGFYGQHCQSKCSSHCPQQLCDNYDGTCNVEIENTTERPPCESPHENCDKVNVAQGKIADMSTPYQEPGYGSGPASLAVDGNTSTYYTSCVHTMGKIDNEPDWWQVDLGRNYTVTDITIYHREGGLKRYPHSQRIAAVSVYVDGTLCYSFPSSVNIGNAPKERDDITCQRPIRGQIVKFAKDGFVHAKHYSFINFCEVQIWVCRSGLYGKQCENQCDSHCQQGTCDNYDGTCDIGCSEGYYGADCSEQCGQCQGQETCDRHTGQCPHGCQPGYRPPECQLPAVKTTTTPVPTTTSTTVTTTQPTSTAPSTSSPVKSPPIPSTIPTSASPTATRKEDNSMDSHNKSKNKGRSSSSSSSSNNIPVKNDARRQKKSNDNSKSTNKEYTKGDMAGMAVSMIIVGAILGTAGLALYCRFFGRRHGLDGMTFSLMETSRSDIS